MPAKKNKKGKKNGGRSSVTTPTPGDTITSSSRAPADLSIETAVEISLTKTSPRTPESKIPVLATPTLPNFSKKLQKSPTSAAAKGKVAVPASTNKSAAGKVYAPLGLGELSPKPLTFASTEKEKDLSGKNIFSSLFGKPTRLGDDFAPQQPIQVFMADVDNGADGEDEEKHSIPVRGGLSSSAQPPTSDPSSSAQPPTTNPSSSLGSSSLPHPPRISSLFEPAYPDTTVVHAAPQIMGAEDDVPIPPHTPTGERIRRYEEANRPKKSVFYPMQPVMPKPTKKPRVMGDEKVPVSPRTPPQERAKRWANELAAVAKGDGGDGGDDGGNGRGGPTRRDSLQRSLTASQRSAATESIIAEEAEQLRLYNEAKAEAEAAAKKKQEEEAEVKKKAGEKEKKERETAEKVKQKADKWKAAKEKADREKSEKEKQKADTKRAFQDEKAEKAKQKADKDRAAKQKADQDFSAQDEKARREKDAADAADAADQFEKEKAKALQDFQEQQAKAKAARDEAARIAKEKADKNEAAQKAKAEADKEKAAKARAEADKMFAKRTGRTHLVDDRLPDSISLAPRINDPAPVRETRKAKRAREVKERAEAIQQAREQGVDPDEIFRRVDGTPSVTDYPLETTEQETFQDYAEEEENKDKECVELALAALDADNKAQMDLVGRIFALEYAFDAQGKLVKPLTDQLEDDDRLIKKLKKDLEDCRKKKESSAGDGKQEENEALIQRLKKELEKCKKEKKQPLPAGKGKQENEAIIKRLKDAEEKQKESSALATGLREELDRCQKEKAKTEDSKTTAQLRTANKTVELQHEAEAAEIKRLEGEIRSSKKQQELDAMDTGKITLDQCKERNAEERGFLEGGISNAKKEADRLKVELAKAKKNASSGSKSSDDDVARPLRERIAVLDTELLASKKEFRDLSNALRQNGVPIDHSVLKGAIYEATRLQETVLEKNEEIKQLSEELTNLRSVKSTAADIVKLQKEVNLVREQKNLADEDLARAHAKIDAIEKENKGKKEKQGDAVDRLKEKLSRAEKRARKIESDAINAENLCETEKDELTIKMDQLNDKIQRMRNGGGEDPWGSEPPPPGEEGDDSIDYNILRVEAALINMVHQRSLYGLRRGDTNVALASAREAVAHADRLENRALEGRARFWFGVTLYYSNNLNHAIEQFDEAADRVEWLDPQREQKWLAAWQDFAGPGNGVSKKREDYWTATWFKEVKNREKKERRVRRKEKRKAAAK